MIKGMSQTLNHAMPGATVLSSILSILLNLVIITALFAMIFKFLPDAKIGWGDVWIGAGLTTLLFIAGKWALGLYLGSGSAGSAYGAVGSLITTLVWVYYSAQIMLFGAEFTQVYANEFGSQIEPEAHAVRIEKKVVEIPANPAA
jgi:membrane protein